MRKAIIITLYGNENYGNKLQNYALQEYVRNKNVIVNTLTTPFAPYNDEREIIIIKIKKIMKSIIKSICCDNKEKSKITKMRLFSENELYLFNYKKSTDGNLEKNADFFIYGSDQIWNPNSSPFYNIRLGLFAPKEKNAAYAPSFSVELIDDKYQSIYKKALNNMKFLSSREKKGKEIIKCLSGVESEIVLDPVFLLTKDEWNKRIDKRKINHNKYIFVYYLGGIDKKTEKLLSVFSKSNNYQIINILNKKDKAYVSDPFDFVNYIKNAEYVFTDSFHAVAFSIIYNKNFYVMNRLNSSNMISRINNILSICKLEERLIDTNNFNKEEISAINYLNVNKFINNEIRKSKGYLNNVLNYYKNNK